MEVFLRNLDASISLQRFVWFRRSTAFFYLVLIITTWRIWIPQSSFPQIPLLSIGCLVPIWIDWVLFTTLAGSLGVLVFSGEKFRWETPFCLAVVCAFWGLFLTNQHRLQPWAYLASIGFLPLAFCTRTRAFAIWRLLLISVYIYSASNKFDFTFLNRMGYRFLDVGLNMIGYEIGQLPGTLREILIFSFPLSELMVGLLLLFRRTRRLGVFAATLFHIGLILILGPTGLGHKSGVLVWNAAFIAHVWFLFSPQEQPTEKTNRSKFQTLVQTVCIGFVLFPLTERFGLCDHWPAWALYSERSAHVEINVKRNKIPALPPAARPFVALSSPNDEWVKIYHEQWSLNSLNAPVYPETRFQLGIALDLGRKLQDANAMMVVIFGVPDRRNGSRTREVLIGENEIATRMKRFHLNAKPRY